MFDVSQAEGRPLTDLDTATRDDPTLFECVLAVYKELDIDYYRPTFR